MVARLQRLRGLLWLFKPLMISMALITSLVAGAFTLLTLPFRLLRVGSQPEPAAAPVWRDAEH